MKKRILTLIVLVIAIAFSVSACDLFGTSNSNVEEGSDTLIGTWTFGDKTSTNMITEIKVENDKVTFTYKVSVGGGSQRVTCVSTKQSVSAITLSASDNDENNRVWELTGTLNSKGFLSIQGTITMIRGYVSSVVTVSAVATSYTPASI